MNMAGVNCNNEIYNNPRTIETSQVEDIANTGKKHETTHNEERNGNSFPTEHLVGEMAGYEPGDSVNMCIKSEAADNVNTLSVR